MQGFLVQGLGFRAPKCRGLDVHRNHTTFHNPQHCHCAQGNRNCCGRHRKRLSPGKFGALRLHGTIVDCLETTGLQAKCVLESIENALSALSQSKVCCVLSDCLVLFSFLGAPEIS